MTVIAKSNQCAALWQRVLAQVAGHLAQCGAHPARTVVLETSVPKDDIPAIGQPIAVPCLQQAPARCRMDTDAGLFTNAIGFGAIVLIWLLGMGTMAVKILRGPRRRTAT